jgi:DNA-directed RNA polymerase specialized sigma24 family protein
MTTTDAELIRRSQREPEVFGSVFDRHVAAVHAFAQRRIGRDLAEEVAAETFARGFEARGRYDAIHDDALP